MRLTSDGMAFSEEIKIEALKTHVRFANGVIKTRRRFTYEEVSAILAAEEGRQPDMTPPPIDADVREMLLRMRDLAKVLHKRRVKRGSLELMMPEIQLEYDANGTPIKVIINDTGLGQCGEKFPFAAFQSALRGGGSDHVVTTNPIW